MLARLVILVYQIPLVTAVTALEFGNAINMAGRQRMLTQRMSKEFLLVAKGFEIDNNKANMAASIALFDSSLHKLMDGSPSDGIPVAPTKDVLDELLVVLEMWTPFRAKLEGNIDRDPIPEDALAYVQGNNVPLLTQANAAVTRFVHAAIAAGVPTSGLQVDVSGRQRMLSQKMSKEVVMIALGTDVEATRRTLLGTMELFAASHRGLLQGQPFLGLPETHNICVLDQMRMVTHLWNDFELLVRRVYYDGVVPDPILQQVATTNPVLLGEMNTAVGLYVTKPSDCQKETSDSSWRAVLLEASIALSLVWQCAKFFLQITLAMDVTTSTTLLQVRFAQAESSLRALVEGSIAKNIAAPWTQSIADAFIAGWANYLNFNENARRSLGTSNISLIEVERADGYAKVALEQIRYGHDLYVEAAHVWDPELPTAAAELATHFSTNVERMVYEALRGRYMSDGATGSLVREASAAAAESRTALLFGRGGETSEVKPTADACTLRHMQDLAVLWEQMVSCAMRFADNVTSTADLQCMVKNAMDMHDPLDVVLEDYIRGPHECQLKTTPLEWETAVLEASRMNALIERIFAEVALESWGLPMEGLSLDDLDQELATVLAKLTVGCTACGVPSAPSHALALQLIQLQELQQEGRRQKTAAPGLLGAAGTLRSLYVTEAQSEGLSGQLGRVAEAGGQLVRLERLLRLAAELQPRWDAELQIGLAEFERSHQRLVEGTPDTAAGEAGHLPPTNERQILPQMRRVWEQFQSLRRQIEDTTGASSRSRSASALQQLREAKAVVASSMQEAAGLYAIARTLAQLRPVNILVALPLTGSWRPGGTMRLAAAVAEDIINEEQALLPGMSLTTTFVDDQCQERQGIRVLLQEVTTSNLSWVGIGGMACSSVCASTAIVATSVRLPVISYGCSAGYLSDAATYTGFVRLATPLSGMVEVVLDLCRRFGWKDFVVVSDQNPEAHEQDPERLVDDLSRSGLAVEWYTASSWKELSSFSSQMLQRRDRQVIILGKDRFLRKVACAARAAGIPQGVAWVAAGLKSHGWYHQDDPEVLLHDETCTGDAISSYVDGLLNIAGNGRHLGPALPLDCFQSHTSESIMQRVQERATSLGSFGTAEFYNDTAELAVDGTCTFAFLVRHMLQEGFALRDLENPTEAVYAHVLAHLRGNLSFVGVTGDVNFTGTDKRGTLAIWQVLKNTTLMVGVASANGTGVADVNGGVSSSSWSPHPPDPPQPRFPYVAVIIPAMLAVVCSGLIAGGIRGWKQGSRASSQDASASQLNSVWA